MADPKLRLHLDELSHDGTALFVSQVDACRLLPNAISHVLQHLYTPCSGSKVPATRSVTLVLRSMDGVAYSTGLQLDDDHKEIHLSLNHIQTTGSYTNHQTEAPAIRSNTQTTSLFCTPSSYYFNNIAQLLSAEVVESE